MTIHLYSTQGKRPYQEDRYVIKKYYSNNSTASETENFNRLKVDFIGVFDGHGGGEISQTISEKLPQYFYKQNILTNNIPRPLPEYNKYIINTFDNFQNELNIKHNKSSSQGSTVCSILIYEYKNKKFVTSIGLGDSRATACNQYLIANALTLDHKPDTPIEMQRIKQLGGSITFEKNDVPRVNGILAVSKSLGDFDQKKFIGNIPTICHYASNYKFIVNATDGLWDVMDNQSVINFVLNNIYENPEVLKESRDKKSKMNIASKLAEKAMELGSEDNITIIIYFMDNQESDYTKYLE
jgi:serine/threonine protein phosphatase PrpC